MYGDKVRKSLYRSIDLSFNFSTTQQTKTKTGVYENKGRYFLAHNSLTDVGRNFYYYINII
jgi:hypothetical protein